ncbi:MAG: alpha/beta hydrolase [Candidatus Binatia bacterium]|nr:alpha/beta hydrolase [Candidatus Binatia bacterium]
MVSWIFLAVSIVGLAFTLSARFRFRLGPALVPYFFAGWLTSELALVHLAWQALATVLFAAAGALDSWPGILGLFLTFGSWWGLLGVQSKAGEARETFAKVLGEGLGAEFARPEPGASLSRLARPFGFKDSRVERIRDIAYGEAGKRNLLDVYRPASRPEGCPVLLQIHGGAWTVGQKDQQGLPLMTHLASNGWVCFAPNYRLSPKATWPDHLVDVKRALAWIRENGAEYGADPNLVVVTGGSAGGHLAAMVALSENDPQYQPGFEHVDTSVAACVPFYGVYDFLDRNGVRGSNSMTPFAERLVMKCSPVAERDRWEAASPVSLIHEDAPPFFVIHGTHDSLVFVEEARLFVDNLQHVSKNPVLYAELDEAQHAFEIFHSERSTQAVRAVTVFAEAVRAGKISRQQPGVRRAG